jgi:hypothetical protein
MAGPDCDSNPEACRGIRGGSFTQIGSLLAASWRDHTLASSSGYWQGFRLAIVPEPGTGLLVIAGLLGLAARRRTLA